MEWRGEVRPVLGLLLLLTALWSLSDAQVMQETVSYEYNLFMIEGIIYLWVLQSPVQTESIRKGQQISD